MSKITYNSKLRDAKVSIDIVSHKDRGELELLFLPEIISVYIQFDQVPALAALMNSQIPNEIYAKSLKERYGDEKEVTSTKKIPRGVKKNA